MLNRLSRLCVCDGRANSQNVADVGGREPRSPRPARSPWECPEAGGSRRHCPLRLRGGNRIKQLTDSWAKGAIVDRTSNLEQQVGTSSRPSHLLRLVHPPIDQEVGRPFDHRSSDRQACTVSFGLIDEPRALASEMGVDLVQRVPKLARCHASGAMTVLALEEVHALADARERQLGIPGLAVPDPPV